MRHYVITGLKHAKQRTERRGIPPLLCSDGLLPEGDQQQARQRGQRMGQVVDAASVGEAPILQVT